MKAVVLVLTALVWISSAEPLFIKMQREGHLNEEDLPNRKSLIESSQSVVVAPPAESAVFGSCVDIVFNKAQADFNSAVGADPGLTWRNANSIQRRVSVLLFANNTGLGQVCDARQLFSATLGFTYPECINRFYLLNKGNTDINNCVIYVHLYKHLEFICSVAYEFYEDPNSRQCIQLIQNSVDYNNCLSTFQTSISANPNSLCPFVYFSQSKTPSRAADTMTKCVQQVGNKLCGPAHGWMICEEQRVGYGYDCPNLQCKVAGQV